MPDNINKMPDPLSAAPNVTAAGEVATATLPGCEVVELDQDTGWDRWEDSKFVQDFEDSILG